MHGRWATRLAVAALAGGLAGLVAPPATSALSGAVGTVQTAGRSLNVRSGPTTAHAVVGSLRNGARFTVVCQVRGELIDGRVRRTTTWNHLATGRYVSDAYVRWRRGQRALPTCRYRSAVVHTGGPGLNLRTGPGTRHLLVGSLPEGTGLRVQCQAYGEMIDGMVRRTNLWNRLPRGRYVSDAYVRWSPSRPESVPWCGQQLSARSQPRSETGFIPWAAANARKSKAKYRVPVSVSIAQAILESRWGRSGLTRVDHNFFGIKCFGSPGPIAIGCRSYNTSECAGRRCYRTTAQFRVYRNAADSFLDHGRFLVVNPRYRKAFSYVNNPNRFAVEIHKAGYATSPTYARNLINLMRRYNLYRYD